MDRCERRRFFNRRNRIPHPEKKLVIGCKEQHIPAIAGLNTAFLQHLLLMIEPAAPRMGRGGVQFVQLFCEDLLQSCKAGQAVLLLKLRLALDERHGVLDEIFRHVVALRR